MKAGFETGIIFFFGMMFLIMSLSMTNVVLMYNQARLTQENALSLIEHQNRYDEEVQELITQSARLCNGCTINIVKSELYEYRYMVSVTFPIRLPMFGFTGTGSTEAMTRVVH